MNKVSLLVSFTVLTALSNVSRATIIGDRNYSSGCLYGETVRCIANVISSLPTLIVADQKVNWESDEGRALLLREAVLVLKGGKSLIVSSREDAQTIFDNMSK